VYRCTPLRALLPARFGCRTPRRFSTRVAIGSLARELRFRGNQGGERLAGIHEDGEDYKPPWLLRS